MENKKAHPPTIKVAVVGASGYTGSELLRLLYRHLGSQISIITSEQNAGQPLKQVFPTLDRYPDLYFEKFKVERVAEESRFVFIALPHKTAMEPVAQLVQRDKKVVDLSADYRFNDPMTYEKWYRTPHTYPQILKDSVYGLPEVYRKKIKTARLVGNPGCYPTGALLGLYPLMQEKGIGTEEILIDSKSGVSGAGRSPSLASHFPEVSEGLGPYQAGTHRHTPEIQQEIDRWGAPSAGIFFVPHLVPMNRGILTTLYIRLNKTLSVQNVHEIYGKIYSQEPFIRILPEGRLPHTRNVRGTNNCEIGIVLSPSSKSLIIFTAIDNLVKGAAGQAIQNMNLMMGYDEGLGLDVQGFYP